MCEIGEYELLVLPVEIDKCLVPLIEMLNKYGIRTLYCCCGHGQKSMNSPYVSVAPDNVDIKVRKNGRLQRVNPQDLNIAQIVFNIKVED